MYRLLQIMKGMDSLVRPTLSFLGRRWSAFHLVALLGFMLGMALSVVLTASRNLKQPISLGLIAFACLTFLGIAALTKIVEGRESMVYLRYFIVIGGAVGVLLWVIGLPTLLYLEILMLGVGLFQAIGRMGCLMVGCCHGRPYTIGVRYRSEHAQKGFPDYLVGVRLLPVQMWEMGWGIVAVSVGCWYVVSDAIPGSGLSAYVVLYSTGRFFLEFARGDVNRPHLASLSEAQWTAVGLVLLTVAASWYNLLPAHASQQVLAACLVLSSIVCIIWHRHSRTHRLVHPHHIRELARGLKYLPALDQHGVPSICQTSLGIRLSSGLVERSGHVARHLTFSGREALTSQEAHALGRLMLRLLTAAHSGVLVVGRVGVFHLVFREDDR